MNKVECLIAGTQKGGTTALFNYLANHPDLCMPRFKEAHYFDEFYHYGNDEKYLQFFREPNKIKIDATGSYMFFKKCYKRIYKYNPDMKLVFLLRDPSDRAYSQWQMQKEKNPNLEFTNKEYIKRGFYAKQIKGMMKYFPKSQMLFLRNRDLLDNPLTTLNKICEFLNISKFEKITESKVMLKDKGFCPMDRPQRFAPIKLRRKLIPYFLKDIEELENITGWDLTLWK